VETVIKSHFFVVKKLINRVVMKHVIFLGSKHTAWRYLINWLCSPSQKLIDQAVTANQSALHVLQKNIHKNTPSVLSCEAESLPTFSLLQNCDTLTVVWFQESPLDYIASAHGHTDRVLPTVSLEQWENLSELICTRCKQFPGRIIILSRQQASLYPQAFAKRLHAKLGLILPKIHSPC
jgi:hypothetical protein